MDGRRRVTAAIHHCGRTGGQGHVRTVGLSPHWGRCNALACCTPSAVSILGSRSAKAGEGWGAALAQHPIGLALAVQSSPSCSAGYQQPCCLASLPPARLLGVHCEEEGGLLCHSGQLAHAASPRERRE